MRIHVILDQDLDVVAFVPVTDAWPRVVLEPIDRSHTLHEDIDVSDDLAHLRGIDAVAHVRDHMRRHLA